MTPSLDVLSIELRAEVEVGLLDIVLNTESLLCLRQRVHISSTRSHFANHTQQILYHQESLCNRSLDFSMGKYSESEGWADVVPIPQNEGGPNPLAAIAYSEEYREAMEYLRAVMASDEKSERVLELTEHIISMNPAHYTVW